MSDRRPPQAPLDPRAPLVIDTRELGRRPGSLRRVMRSVPAPPGLGLELVGVPPGAPVELSLRLEAVMEGVLVSGTVRAPVAGECGRCLDPVSGRVDVPLQELYAYPDRRGDPPDVWRLQGDLMDLEPALRDAVLLALPMTPRCRDDCPGLCPTCGDRLADAGRDHRHGVADPRWAGLVGILGTSTEPTEE